MELQKIKDELKEMYPKMQGFIQHTLVAEMCLKWHEKQLKNCSIPVVGRSELLPDSPCTLARYTCGKGNGCKYPFCDI